MSQAGQLLFDSVHNSKRFILLQKVCVDDIDFILKFYLDIINKRSLISQDKGEMFKKQK